MPRPARTRDTSFAAIDGASTVSPAATDADAREDLGLGAAFSR